MGRSDGRTEMTLTTVRKCRKRKPEQDGLLVLFQATRTSRPTYFSSFNTFDVNVAVLGRTVLADFVWQTTCEQGFHCYW